MKLADCIGGRDNNFNLIRIIAAYSVLLSHCYPLALGKGVSDPLSTMIGMSLGYIAVDVFFLASGFLVTGSLLSRQDTVAFLWARALRIFPALFVMLILTVGGLGIFISSLPATDFFTDPVTRKYFLRCLTLINGIKYELPGVFNDNPYEKAVNGSLWSLRYELRLYLILALLWFGLRLTGMHRVKIFRILIIAGAASFGFLLFAGRFDIVESGHVFYRLGFMFLAGGSFYILRKHVVLSGRTTIAVCLAMILAAKASSDAFFVVYSLALGYLVLYASYIPAGYIRRYNRFGDYSYGVYIYAFPVQQVVASLVPGVSVLEMLVLSSVPTLILAMLSWHLVEARVLKLKNIFRGSAPPVATSSGG